MAELFALAGGALMGGLRCAGAGAAALLALAAPATAQEESRRCLVLCTPDFRIEPTLTVENLFQRPVIETLDEDGQVLGSEVAERERVFELIFAVGVPTTIPRLGLTFEAIFVPFGEADTHPFTGAPASEVPGGKIRDNGVEIEAELNIDLFGAEDTSGWLSSHFDIVDKFSPGETPGAQSVYTHKLNFEWDTALHPFHRLPAGSWLRNVELEVSLDYVATGLPKAGDVLGDEHYVEDASPWSVSFVLVLPLAPLVP